MDTRELDVARRRAGADYLKALDDLGMRPQALLWAQDNRYDGEFVLILITELFDYAGPLSLAQMLFKAYDRAGTPREVDPFIVRAYSPAQRIAREMSKFRPDLFRAETYEGGPAVVTSFTYDDFVVRTDWIYRFEDIAKHNFGQAARRWKAFQMNVEKLAA